MPPFPLNSVPERPLGYTLGACLGRGAMGVVYAAQRDNGPVRAIKLVPLALGASQEARRLQREVTLTSRLSHRNLLTILESGVVGAHFAIVMEYLNGGAADAFIARPTPWQTVVRVMRMAAQGLDHAWRTGHMIHRDIKPANILLMREEERIVRAVVGDFGLARESGGAEGMTLTKTGMILGTPWYIAPEQAQGERDLDHRCDQYALGASLHHMLCGAPPFGGKTPTDCIIAHLHDPVPRFKPRENTAPEALGTIIATCMAKDRADRFPDHAALVMALSAVIDGADQDHITSIISKPTTDRITKSTSRWTRPTTARFARGSSGELPTVSATPGTDLPLPVVTLDTLAQPPKDEAIEAVLVEESESQFTLAIGTQIDEYHIIDATLGRGGMGEVYRLKDQFLGRHLAMKILPPGADATTLEKFRDEGNALASLTHPAFPAYAGAGVFADRHYVLMEILQGTDLRAVIREKGPMSEAQVIPIARCLVEALSDGFRRCGLVHRDIKPHNLVLGDDERTPVRIVDLGLAAYFAAPDPDDFTGQSNAYREDEHAGKPVGTPAYMSPEQCRGEAATPAMDVYSIGATLFHLLSGKTMYTEKSAMGLVAMQLSGPIPDLPSYLPISRGMRTIIHRCLQKNPTKRFVSYRDLAAALAGLE